MLLRIVLKFNGSKLFNRSKILPVVIKLLFHHSEDHIRFNPTFMYSNSLISLLDCCFQRLLSADTSYIFRTKDKFCIS